MAHRTRLCRGRRVANVLRTGSTFDATNVKPINRIYAMARIQSIKDIPLDDLVIGKGQVRVRDVGKEIDELADSISKVGLLEPIVVCPAAKAGKYQILTGQRRFLAHQQLRKKTIMAVILDQAVDEMTA